MSSLQDLVEQTKLLKKKMQDDGKEAMKQAFSSFFNAHPEARAIVWTQYTPYFNDGDACTFRVNEMVLKGNKELLADDLVKALDEEDDDFNEYEGCVAQELRRLQDSPQNRRYYPDRNFRQLSESEQSLLTDFDNMVQACNEIPEVLEMVLGDHVKVIATRDGFDVDEYDHD